MEVNAGLAALPAALNPAVEVLCGAVKGEAGGAAHHWAPGQAPAPALRPHAAPSSPGHRHARLCL